MCSKFSSVNTSPNVARIAAVDSTLPARVPPDSPDVDQVGVGVVPHTPAPPPR
jgi:hypothetical protein